MADTIELPTVKKNICFADTFQNALDSISSKYTDEQVPDFSTSEKLMLFGVEGLDAGGKKLSEAFRKNKFENLEIFGSELKESGAKALAEGLRTEGGSLIRSFELDNSPLTQEGAKYIIEALNESGKCEFLNLQGSVKDKGAFTAMAKALKNNKTIQKLDLKINGLNTDSANDIGILLNQNMVLVDLDLFYNDIGKDGAKAIADHLKNDNCVLEILNLCCNKIGDDGAVELGAALETNSSLRELHLALNDIKDDGAARICDALNQTNKKEKEQNRSLEVLDISANAIADIGAKSIASCILYNSTLKMIDFTGIECKQEGWEYFESAFQTLNFVKTDSQLIVKFSIVDISDEMLERVETSIGDNFNIDYKRRDYQKE